MARLKDVQYSQTGAEENHKRQVRAEEEALSAMMAAPDVASSEKFRIFKLSDTTKKGKYHMECVDDVLDPQTKKMVRIRLVRGVETIYQSEQKGLDEKFLMANRRSLIFDNRVLRVPEWDTAAIEFLEKCNANIDNPNKKGTRKLTFFEWNPVRQAEIERQKRIRKVEAIKFASLASDNDMVKHAVYLGIPLIDELGIQKTPETLRNDYELYAESQYEKFLQSAGSKEIEIGYIVNKAIIDSKIDLGVRPGSAYWSNDGGFICKIPANTKPKQYLIEYALMPNDESKAFLNQLKKLS